MRGKSKVRYAYAITAALLLGGTAIAVTSHNPVGAQTAQNEGPAMQAVAPRGAPTSFANMVERLQPAVVNISTRQHVEVQNPFAGTPFGSLFGLPGRSEEHTSELQSLMRISYAVFCLKTKTQTANTITQ